MTEPRPVAEILAHLYEFRQNGTVPCGSLFSELEQAIAIERDSAVQDATQTLTQRIGGLERTLARHAQFRQTAGGHIDALLTAERGSPAWQAAADWWSQVNVRVVRSDADPA